MTTSGHSISLLQIYTTAAAAITGLTVRWFILFHPNAELARATAAAHQNFSAAAGDMIWMQGGDIDNIKAAECA
jgi:hypothetical protein